MNNNNRIDVCRIIYNVIGGLYGPYFQAELQIYHVENHWFRVKYVTFSRRIGNMVLPCAMSPAMSVSRAIF